MPAASLHNRQLINEQRATRTQFVLLSDQGEHQEKYMQIARSHAASHIHARKKADRLAQLEIHQYQPSRSNIEDDTTTEVVPQSLRTTLIQHQNMGQFLSQPSQLALEKDPDPQGALTYSRRNPIQSYARNISSMEGSLIDHCKLLYPMSRLQ